MRPVSGQTIAAFCAMALVAGCVTDGGGGASVSQADSALGERLADTRLDLAATDPVADPAAGPMVMRLRADGTGEMDYAGLSLTYRWQARGRSAVPVGPAVGRHPVGRSGRTMRQGTPARRTDHRAGPWAGSHQPADERGDRPAVTPRRCARQP